MKYWYKDKIGTNLCIKEQLKWKILFIYISINNEIPYQYISSLHFFLINKNSVWFIRVRKIMPIFLKKSHVKGRVMF